MTKLLHGIKKVSPSACVLTSLCLEKDESMPPSLPEAAEQFMLSHDIAKPIEEIGPAFLEKCQLNEPQRNKIEKATRGQHSSDLWFLHRRGRITASQLHGVHTKTNSLLQKRHKKRQQYTPLVARLV